MACSHPIPALLGRGREGDDRGHLGLHQLAPQHDVLIACRTSPPAESNDAMDDGRRQWWKITEERQC